MNVVAACGFAVAGALASIPVTAVAYAVSAHSTIRIPPRWWRGAPAPPSTTFSVALLTGPTAGVVAISRSWSLAMPAFWLVAVLGIGLAIIDIRCHRLPHVMTGTLWAACGLGLIAESLASGHAHSLVTGAVAGAGVVALTLLIAFALPGQLGLGDVSFSGVIALSLGGISLHTAALGLVSGIGLQACIAVASQLRDHGRLSHNHLPFGPALLMGWFVALTTSAT